MTTTDPMAAAREGAAKAHLERIERDKEHVAAWQAFLKAEREAFTKLLAGEIERDEWLALWQEKWIDPPTKAQYANAGVVT